MYTCVGHEAHVDHHGRTYYMDHDTRTIAYNGGDRGGRGAEERGETEVGGSPARRNPREIQTRREMLNRRSVVACTCTFVISYAYACTIM